jgi:regulator of protease activity HflC (stomatin/prohibitin superfamily)
MFDKIVEILNSWWHQILPITIVSHYQEAVLLRMGKFKAVLKPGLHFKIPFFDEVLDQYVVVTTLSLPAQSLYTKDRQNIVAKGVIKYKISDVKIFMLEVYDAKDALSDMTTAIIKQIITDLSLEECLNADIDNTLTKKARVEARKWGVEIQQVTLTDLAPIRSYRLISDSILNKTD